MQTSWLERHFVPLRRWVRHYEEARLAALEHGLVLARQAAERPPTTGGVGLPPEAELVTPDGKLGGRLDAVIPTPAGIVIRDYKTGQVYDEDEGGGRALKERYQLQMRLYAILYAHAKGPWPAHLEVVTSRGEVIEVPFTPEECEAVYREAIQRLDDLARQVGEVQRGRVPLETLANPAGETCRFCPYRPMCCAYRLWCEAQSAGEEKGLQDAWGMFIGTRPGRSGVVLLDLESVSGRRRILDLSPNPSRNPALTVLRPGDAVSLFNVRPQGASGGYSATDFTVIYADRPADG
jgi:hypothetical protein